MVIPGVGPVQADVAADGGNHARRSRPQLDVARDQVGTALPVLAGGICSAE
jgi:hypothetical protein